MKNIKYHNIKIVQKSKQIFVERGKIDTQNTHILFMSWYCHINTKMGRVTCHRLF